MRPEYVVISERLIQEVLDRAATTGFKLENVQIRPPFSAASIRKGEATGNYHLLAEQVEAALYDYTGTPEYPGDYIGTRAHFKGWVFSFDAERTPVVWLSAEWSGTLLVLCGSARNVLGYSAPNQYTGWRPSDAGGLREVVLALRRKDPKKLLAYRAALSKQEEMAADAAWITNGLLQAGPADIEEELDVLLKPHVYVENFDRASITGIRLTYDRVIVGAPLWARRPSDLPPPGHKDASDSAG
jgi:hypothetical protein